MGYFVEYAETNAKKKVIEYVYQHLDNKDFLEEFLSTFVEQYEKVQLCSDAEWIENRGSL